ncbi:MAG: polysaccharide biosynthesis/export family protein, partial [Myxococcota bacterium]
MSHPTNRHHSRPGPLLAIVLVLGTGQLLGCEVDSFFDPSRTGRFEHMPTTIPILERIDVIEQEDEPLAATTGVLPEDLLPSDLTYRFGPGDLVTIEIEGMLAPGEWVATTRRIDAGGTMRLRGVGDIVAAGLTIGELENLIIHRLEEQIIEPQVDVNLQDGGAFHYIVYGAIPTPGLFTLRSTNFRLLDALAVAGGVPLMTEKVFVIRDVPLTEEVKPAFERDREDGPPAPAPGPEPPVDIEQLIEQLEGEAGGVRPGLLPPNDQPRLEPDELEPVTKAGQAPVDVDELAARRRLPLAGLGGDETFIFIPERDEWIRVLGGDASATTEPGEPGPAPDPAAMIRQRIIEVPYQRLSRGESSFNLVIRPNDRIYVDGPTTGFVYVDGEIARPGVYSLPSDGKLTLSRLVSAAGGLGALAIPERVDLTRIVGENREATIRLNLAAIRQKTEPDLYLKPDDHVIIGTNWVATPLAIIRNGFR